MALTWVRKFTQNVNSNKNIDVSKTLKSEYLILSVSCIDCRDTWHRAGYLSQFLNVLPLRKTLVNNSIPLLLNTPTLLSFEHWQLGYQLRFEPVNWLTKFTLEIYDSKMPF